MYIAAGTFENSRAPFPFLHSISLLSLVYLGYSVWGIRSINDLTSFSILVVVMCLIFRKGTLGDICDRLCGMRMREDRRALFVSFFVPLVLLTLCLKLYKYRQASTLLNRQRPIVPSSPFSLSLSTSIPLQLFSYPHNASPNERE